MVGLGKFLAANTGVNTGGRVVAFPDWAGNGTEKRAPAIDPMMYFFISTSLTGWRAGHAKPARYPEYKKVRSGAAASAIWQTWLQKGALAPGSAVIACDTGQIR